MDQIEESLINYVKNPKTNYAILLNGAWGSGKTYYWENCLKPSIKNIKIDDTPLKTIYVSLYGISDLEEIDKKIFLDNFLSKNNKLRKASESKIGGRISELSKITVGVAKNLDIPILKDILPKNISIENLLDFKNTVLCFDDLERVNIEIADVLGYINKFVEHDGVKVLIIANEKEISNKLISKNLELKMLVASDLLKKELSEASDEKEKYNSEKHIWKKINNIFNKSNDYDAIKEKLIGKTLTLSPNYNELVIKLIDNVNDENFKKFLSVNSDSITSVFLNSQTNNLRILRQALDDSKIIYEYYKSEFGDLGDEVLANVIVYTLAASFEIKSNIPGNKELHGVSQKNINSLTFGYMFDEKQRENNYLIEFQEKYKFNLNIKEIQFYSSVEILVRKGIFNKELFNKEINQIIQTQTPNFLKLIRDGYWTIEDNDFLEVEKEAYLKLKNGKINFVLYYNAFITYKDLIENDLITNDLKTVKKDFWDGLNRSSENGEYIESISRFLFQIDDSDIMELRGKILDINNRLKNKEDGSELESLIYNMKDDFNNFLNIIDKKYFCIPIFSLCSTDLIFKKLISLSNMDTKKFIFLLERRYIINGMSTELKKDKGNLELLQQKIIEHISNKSKNTPKTVILKEICKVITKCLNSLDEMKKI